MCILIANKSKQLLSKETIKNSLENNPDGVGFMSAMQGDIITYKLPANSKLDTVWSTYKEWRDSCPNTVYIHFRISTGGDLSLNNCHPHKITNNLWVMHNGILTLKHKDSLSDTARLAQLLSQDSKIEENIFKNETLASQSVLEWARGSNKLIFLRNDGKNVYINKQLGHTDKLGNWYSNHTYTYGANFEHDYSYSAYGKYKGSYNDFYDTHKWDNNLKQYVPVDALEDY
jgi:predicted glutamine amidotransferase